MTHPFVMLALCTALVGGSGLSAMAQTEGQTGNQAGGQTGGQATADSPQTAQAPAPAEVAPQAPADQTAAAEAVAKLSQALMIPGVVDVLRLEGLDYGNTLEEQMFPERGGARWQAAVSAIYDADWIRGEFEKTMRAELGDKPQVIAAGQKFFGSELGQRVVALEIEARHTLLDPAAEEAARLRYAEMADAKEPRAAALAEFAEANDLIEANVVGALNANLAFYQGMAAAGAADDGMTEEEMLAEVWSQEDSVRAETEEWLFPYLALAYSALSDEDLAQYIAFSRTPEGKALNLASFTAFDRIFVTISQRLGAAAAAQLQGQDI